MDNNNKFKEGVKVSNRLLSEKNILFVRNPVVWNCPPRWSQLPVARLSPIRQSGYVWYTIDLPARHRHRRFTLRGGSGVGSVAVDLSGKLVGVANLGVRTFRAIPSTPPRGSRAMAGSLRADRRSPWWWTRAASSPWANHASTTFRDTDSASGVLGGPSPAPALAADDIRVHGGRPERQVRLCVEFHLQ